MIGFEDIKIVDEVPSMNVGIDEEVSNMGDMHSVEVDNANSRVLASDENLWKSPLFCKFCHKSKESVKIEADLDQIIEMMYQLQNVLEK